MIDMVTRQTEYSYDEAKEKLEKIILIIRLLKNIWH